MTSIGNYRQARQQRLDHALIEAIKKNDTKAAIALLDQGADANTTAKPYHQVTFKSLLVDFWNKINGNVPVQSTSPFPSALILTIYNRSGGWVDIVDNSKLVQVLLIHGADPYATDEEGY